MPTARRFSRAFLIALLAPAVTACSSRPVVSELSAAEAQRCAVVLRAAGLDVSVERDSGAGESERQIVLKGDEADFRTALQVLEDHSLPHRAVAGFSTEPASLIPTATEERARFMKGLSGEIEALLESVDGVVAAEVLVSIPERRPLAPSSSEPASASVVVSHRDDACPVSEPEIRSLVVQCVGPTLAGDRVSVLLKPVVRAGSPSPVVRYQRDRTVELGFLGCVACFAAVEVATLVLLRRARSRIATLEENDHAPDA